MKHETNEEISERLITMENKTNEEIKETLIKAKEIISDPDKWIKDNYYDPDREGCYCSLGALGMAEDGHPSGFSFSLKYYLSEGLPEGLYSVADFNDDPETTHSDVMAMFDKAIAARDK